MTIQLDVIHVLEYLWRAAYCFSEEGTAEAEVWVTERLLEVLRGKSSEDRKGIAPDARGSTVQGAAEWLATRLGRQGPQPAGSWAASR